MRYSKKLNSVVVAPKSNLTSVMVLLFNVNFPGAVGKAKSTRKLGVLWLKTAQEEQAPSLSQAITCHLYPGAYSKIAVIFISVTSCSSASKLKKSFTLF